MNLWQIPVQLNAVIEIEDEDQREKENSQLGWLCEILNEASWNFILKDLWKIDR